MPGDSRSVARAVAGGKARAATGFNSEYQSRVARAGMAKLSAAERKDRAKKARAALAAAYDGDIFSIWGKKGR